MDAKSKLWVLFSKCSCLTVLQHCVLLLCVSVGKVLHMGIDISDKRAVKHSTLITVMQYSDCTFISICLCLGQETRPDYWPSEKAKKWENQGKNNQAYWFGPVTLSLKKHRPLGCLQDSVCISLILIWGLLLAQPLHIRMLQDRVSQTAKCFISHPLECSLSLPQHFFPKASAFLRASSPVEVESKLRGGLPPHVDVSLGSRLMIVWSWCFILLLLRALQT